MKYDDIEIDIDCVLIWKKYVMAIIIDSHYYDDIDDVSEEPFFPKAK